MGRFTYGVLALVVLVLGTCLQGWATVPLQGQVRNIITGEPIAGAVVTCGEELVRTEAGGHFAISPGGEKLRVRFPGYQRYVQPTRSFKKFSGLVLLTPFSPRALYLSFYGVAEPVLRNPALALIDQTPLNALVIDIKGDTGLLPYPSSIEQAEKIGAQKVITMRKPAQMVESFKKRGIYTIARIVTFKDDLLARARPELAIKNREGQIWRDGMGLAWADPFAKEARSYNLQVAEEAAKMGFDEIQFDYIRFPEPAGQRFQQESTEETRVRAISSFLAEARRRLAPYNVFISADIFGYVCWNKGDTHIGQQLEELTRHLDYVAPMLYPSGFSHGVGPYRNPVAHPLKVIELSLNKARERTGVSPVRFRPWLQAFRDYAFDRRRFGDKEIRGQIRAAEQFGANGWMLWNARNVYTSAGLIPFDPVDRVFTAKAQTDVQLPPQDSLLAESRRTALVPEERRQSQEKSAFASLLHFRSVRFSYGPGHRVRIARLFKKTHIRAAGHKMSASETLDKYVQKLSLRTDDVADLHLRVKG